MKTLAILFIALSILITSNVMAQTCPSTITFIRIVAFNEENKPVHLRVLQVPAKMLPGDDFNCPNQNVSGEMVSIDHENKTITPMSVVIEKGAVSNPLNVLSDEEIRLYKEKGIVNPPKQQPNQQKQIPTIPKKGSTTADASAEALRSSIY